MATARGAAGGMVAAGVAFEEEPHTEHHGRVVIFRDTAGNRWELIGRH